jgi:serine/threonine-protein kinase
VLVKLLEEPIAPPSTVEPSLPQKLDPVVMMALERDMSRRYSSARQFAMALEQVARPAFPREVGEWVESVGGDSLSRRAEQVAEIESVSSHVGPQLQGQIQAYSTSPGIGVAVPSQSYTQPAAGPTQEVPSQVTSPSDVRHSMVSQPSAVSQPSNATLPSQAVASFHKPKRGALIAALLGVAAALGIAFVVLLVALVGRRQGGVEAAASPPATQEAVPAPTNLEPATPPASAAVVVEPEPIPSASASAAPTAKATTRWKKPVTKTTAPKATAKATSASPPPKPAKNCNPPYTIDKNGIKRPKPECL